MPNTRRRKFSVQNDFSKRDPNKIQNSIICNQIEQNPEIKTTAPNIVSRKSTQSKRKTYQNTSKSTTSSEIVTFCESSTSVVTVKKQSTTTFDKDVTASSSNINLCNNKLIDDDLVPTKASKESIFTQKEGPVKTNDTVQSSRDKTTRRRDRHPREHRVKVRSPRRRVAVYINNNIKNNNNNDSKIQTIGTIAIDWDREVRNNIEQKIIETIEITEDQNICENDNSIDDMCRICHGGDVLSLEFGPLISACLCRGTVGRVHVKCLERWLTESGKSRCELCGTRYLTKRVHRYGVFKALVMWILSQNAKQLMVDSLGIMLMSPMAVLAAWLSGRTLAGLMTQDKHVTPWPLASTFVLACMTLVCYYCWIVSAATRHAIGWWIWYRSQYEVRLQYQDNDD